MRLLFVILVAGILSGCSVSVDDGTMRAMPGQTIHLTMADGTQLTFTAKVNHKLIVRRFKDRVSIEDYTPPKSSLVDRTIFETKPDLVRAITVQ